MIRAAIVLPCLLAGGCGDVGFQRDVVKGEPPEGPDDDDSWPGDDDTGDDPGDDDTGGEPPGDDDTEDTCDDNLADELRDIVFFLDLGDESFEFVEPAGLGPLLQAEIPRDDGAIFSTVGMEACDVEMLFGAGVVTNPESPQADWVWEQTDQTTVLAYGGRAGPQFEIGPFAITTTINDLDVWMGDALMLGRFLPDGTAVEDAVLDFVLDTTEFEPILGFDLCDLASCEPCPASCPHQGPVCLHVVAQGGTCPRIEGMVMLP